MAGGPKVKAEASELTAKRNDFEAESPQAKKRSPEFIKREQERARTFAAAAERPAWPATSKKADKWTGRHQVLFLNDGLNPNVRSYFDRRRELRDPRDPPPREPAKPAWRLNPSGSTPEERETYRQAVLAFSPCGHFREESDKASMSASASEPSLNLSLKLRESRGDPTRPGPGGGGAGGWGLMEDRPEAEAAEDGKEDKWDAHHHINWVNERNCGGALLNPAPLRSYFGRWREPDIGARSAQLPLEDSDDGKKHVIRVVPVWRLDPVRPGEHVPEVREPCPLHPQLHARTGTGGLFKHSDSGDATAKSMSATESRLGVSSMSEVIREQKWEDRHALTFNNEEASKLDRNYFDRPREPEPLRKKYQKELGSTSVWSLGPIISAKLSLAEESPELHQAESSWNSRHQLMFYNKMHPNTRSYFGRFRDIESTAVPPGPAIMDVAPSSPSCPSYATPTVSIEGRQRKKLRDEEKLVVDWKIHEKNLKGFSMESTLRNSASDPAISSKDAKGLEERRAAWFSSHGIYF